MLPMYAWCLVAVAGGAAWDATFTAEAVGPHLLPRGRVAIVAAGGGPGASAAAAALESAARASGRAREVTLAAEQPAASDDAAIVGALAAGRDAVWVVRVFTDGAASTAVVTIYGDEAKAMDAFTGVAGVAPAARVASGQGVLPRAAMGSVDEAVAPIVGTAKARDEYERRRLRFVKSSPSGDIVNGRSGPVLRADKLYDFLQRPDLGQQYRRRARLRIGSAVLGAGAMLGGVVALATIPRCSEYQMRWDSKDCSAYESSSRWHKVFGFGGLALGGALVVAASNTSNDPLSTAERRQLTIEYNRRLAEELGIGAATDEPSERAGLRQSIEGYIAPHGGGVRWTIEL